VQVLKFICHLNTTIVLFSRKSFYAPTVSQTGFSRNPPIISALHFLLCFPQKLPSLLPPIFLLSKVFSLFFPSLVSQALRRREMLINTSPPYQVTILVLFFSLPPPILFSSLLHQRFSMWTYPARLPSIGATRAVVSMVFSHSFAEFHSRRRQALHFFPFFSAAKIHIPQRRWSTRRDPT